MKNRIARYLDKHADLESRPLVAASTENVETVIVIPVLAEREYLPSTLQSIAENPSNDVERTLVICVVNNRVKVEDDARRENEEAILLINNALGGDSPFGALRLDLIDASSPGKELPEGEGVGLARRIGLDWGLRILAQQNGAALVSLDADTTVDTDYLPALREHFRSKDAWAAVIDYAHPFEGDDQHQAAIVCYELFLRYHVLGLRHAASPYAFHSIGSCMACTPEAYASVSGMKKRQGGEDFYFLQELAKTGPVRRIQSTTVHPSPRPSWRVPFGTGPRVRKFLDGDPEAYTLYDPRVYGILRGWLELVSASVSDGAATVIAQAEKLHPELAAYLESQGFSQTWDKIQQSEPDPKRLLAQFHRWFDGLKTLRCIHHLRNHGCTDQNMFDAIFSLLAETQSTGELSLDHNIQNDLRAQKNLLLHMRSIA